MKLEQAALSTDHYVPALHLLVPRRQRLTRQLARPLFSPLATQLQLIGDDFIAVTQRFRIRAIVGFDGQVGTTE